MKNTEAQYYNNSMGFDDDMGNIVYAQIMEVCRPFYPALPTFNAKASALSLPPRLDDALAMKKEEVQQDDSFLTRYDVLRLSWKRSC